MSQNIGQAIMNIINILPQIIQLVLVFRLVFNEILHIVMEPIKIEKIEVTESDVLEAAKEYRKRYGLPPGVEDIGAYIFAKPAVDMINKVLTEDRLSKVREVADKLVLEGKLRKTDHRYDPIL